MNSEDLQSAGRRLAGASVPYVLMLTCLLSATVGRSLAQELPSQAQSVPQASEQQAQSDAAGTYPAPGQASREINSARPAAARSDASAPAIPPSGEAGPAAFGSEGLGTTASPQLSVGQGTTSDAESAPSPGHQLHSPPATPSADGGPLRDTIQSVLARIWKENPQVRQAEQALAATGFDISAARAGYYPYLQLQSSVAQRSQDGVSTLYLVQPLWQGGRTGAQVNVAKAQQRAALAELGRTRLELGQRTIDAYFAVTQAQDEEVQWRNYEGALKRLLDTITRRANQGLAPQADVETAVSRLRQAQAQTQANRARLLTNRAVLASLLNATPRSLSWPDDSFILDDAEQQSAATNRDEHPDVLAARAELEVQKGTAKIARASLTPELSLQHRQQIDGTEFDPSNDATLLVFSYQSSTGVQGFLGYRAEEERIAAAEARLLAAQQQVEATLQIDRAQLTAVTAQLQSQFDAAQSSALLVLSFARQFEAGRKSWLELLNAQREANDLAIQSINLRRQFWTANAKLALDAMYWKHLGAELVSDTSGHNNE